MQLFIPLNTLFSRFVCGRKEYIKHIMFSCFILITCVINFAETFHEFKNDDRRLKQNLIIFAMGQLCNVLSHNFKEAIVRNILVNQTSFLFQIGVAQMVSSLIFILVV